MDIQPPLEARSQLTHGRQPGMRSLHNPAVPAEPLLALDALARNPCRDTPLAQVGAAATAVVSLVSV